MNHPVRTTIPAASVVHTRMRSRRIPAFTLLMAFVLMAALAQAPAQTPAKKAMTVDDYTKWKSIAGQAISGDGKWVVYTFQLTNTIPAEAKPVLHLLNLETNAEVKVEGEEQLSRQGRGCPSPASQEGVMKFSLHEFLKAVVGLVADNHAAGTVNGAGIDRPGFEEALVAVNSGANGAGGTVNVKVQESDDNSTWADVAGAAFAQITEANDNTVYVGRFNLVVRKR